MKGKCFMQSLSTTWVDLFHQIMKVDKINFQFLAHLCCRLTKWVYSIPMIRCRHCRPFTFLARLKSELIVYQSSQRPCVRASVHMFTLSNMNISETNGLIATKFYLKHHWVRGKAAFGFGSDQIRTLVFMADQKHRVVMEKTVSPFFIRQFFSRSFSYLQVMITCMNPHRPTFFIKV